MPQRILNEDWEEYDNRKIRDRKFFACTEPWEVDYLVTVTRKAYPHYSESAKRAAITACCRTVGAPHPREKFVACVMERLRS
jgi:hypothetical protein